MIPPSIMNALEQKPLSTKDIPLFYEGKNVCALYVMQMSCERI